MNKLQLGCERGFYRTCLRKFLNEKSSSHDFQSQSCKINHFADIVKYYENLRLQRFSCKSNEMKNLEDRPSTEHSEQTFL